jgi:leucyl aminopeptidase
VLVVPVETAEDLPARLARLGKGIADAAARALDLGDFKAAPGTQLLFHSRGVERFPRCLLLGLGAPDERSPASVRGAFRSAAQSDALRKAERVAVGCGIAMGTGADLAANVAAAVDGLLDGGYRWTLQSAPPSLMAGSFVFLADSVRDAKRIDEGLHQGGIVGQAVSAARDLANEPANRMSPAQMAKRAQAMAKRTGLRARVLDPAGLAKERCEAILTVGAASSRSPRLIILEHGPKSADPPVVLVGKGLVFDTGGLNIKPGSSMGEMKFDKCGGCVVLGAMQAVAELDLPVRVVGIVPAVENSISGDAYRPGDVIGSRAGKTIEVLNTDAEGRLVLADALDYAVTTYSPRAILDVATLTGAAYHSLGDRACAVLGTDQALVDRVRESGERAGEPAWQLPLWDGYLEDVKTPNADIRNTGAWGGGTIAGAAFLRAFVGDVPWAHLDVANVSRDRRNPSVGATGFGVRLLVDLLQRWPRARAARKPRRR